MELPEAGDTSLHAETKVFLKLNFYVKFYTFFIG